MHIHAYILSSLRIYTCTHTYTRARKEWFYWSV